MSDIIEENFSDKPKSFFNKLFNIEKWKENKNRKLTGSQWCSFFKIMPKAESRLFLILVLIVFTSAIALWRISYLESTKIAPAEGGILKEVIIGQPKSLNPLFSQLNDADRDVSEILYRGLLKYDKKGNIVEDLAEKYKIDKKGRIYEIVLKKNLFWSDGKEISANDIIFTVETMQDPNAQSPLRLSWQNIIKKIEKKDKSTVRFILSDPYPPFIEKLTFKIIPKHIFEKIEPQKLSSTPVQDLVSSGPYRIKEIQKTKGSNEEEQKIEKIILERNENFKEGGLFIDEIEFFFTEEVKISDWEGKKTNISRISAKNKEDLKENFNIYPLSRPTYFALFLNQDNNLLSKIKIRKALALSTPKEKIIKNVLFREGRIVDRPLFPENQINGKFEKYEFSPSKAKGILDKLGWTDKNKDKIRESKNKKNPQKLKFTLYTVNQEELKKAAKLIQEEWEKSGIKIEIKSLEPAKITDVIKNRKYDILLFGQILNMKADPYPFWHSTQKEYPGLNLSKYQNKKIDELLEKSTEEIDEKKRKILLGAFQKKITEDLPAIFLYSPNYLYATQKEIKGIDGKYIIDPSKRFIGIENWYINEKRELK